MIGQSEEELEKLRIEIRKKQEEHPTRCWFDRFYCSFIKKDILNKYTKKTESVLFAVQLQAGRPNPEKTFIEPNNVYGGKGLKGFNEYTKNCGEQQGLMAEIYLEPDTYLPGQVIQDLQYLREIGVVDDTVLTYEDIGYTHEQAWKKVGEIKK